jgi:hypothetical protein
MSLNNVVVDALTRTRQYQGHALWTVENHAKYSTLKHAPGSQQDPHINHQIFMLMCALNEHGINTDGLCADTQGNGSLKSLLARLTRRLTSLSQGNRVHYVELGPEPVKTSYILTRIAQAAATVRYTAIDINATSESAIRDAVIPIIADPINFHYFAADYRTVTQDTLHHDQDLTLITMLGFQEGNEPPVVTGRLIRTLADHTTYIVSEMQVYEEGLESCIHAFYAHPHMLRFSQLIALQQGFVPLGEHETTLLRLKMAGELLHVAITLQPVQHLQQRGYLLTNSCIKYTPEQFRSARRLHGNCVVLEELASGDGSVRYQIAQSLQLQ